MTRLTELMEGPMQHLTAIISFNSTTSEMVLKATTSERKSDRFFEEPKALCCKAFRMNSQTPPPSQILLRGIEKLKNILLCKMQTDFLQIIVIYTST